MHRPFSLLSLAALLIAAPALAAETVDPPAYPELAPAALLPAILAELKHTQPDIYSVREMRICPARGIKLKDGSPVDWGVRIEFNAKNAAGGYSGIGRYYAIFRNRRIAYPITSPQLGRTGLDGVFSRTVDKQMEACSKISDVAIQTALKALAE